MGFPTPDPHHHLNTGTGALHYITATHLHHLERRAHGAPLPPLTKECNVLLHLYTSTPLHRYAATPPQHDASTPLHPTPLDQRWYVATLPLLTRGQMAQLYTSTPLDQSLHGAILHIYTSGPQVVWRNSTPLHLLTNNRIVQLCTSTPLDQRLHGATLHLYTS